MTYALEYNGLIVPTPGYDFAGPPEGLGTPPVTTQRASLQGSHGTTPIGGDTYDSFILVNPIIVAGDDDHHLSQRLDALRKAWRAIDRSNDTATLTLTASGVTRRLHGRPGKVTEDHEWAADSFVVLALCEFEVTDPFGYTDGGQVELRLASAAGLGGTDFPLTFPYFFHGPSSSFTDVATVVVGGTTRTHWRASIVGHVLEPAVAINGARVTFMHEVPAGKTLVLDSRTRTAILAGAPQPVTVTSQWGLLDPDLAGNEVSFTARDSDGGSTATITWENRWL